MKKQLLVGGLVLATVFGGSEISSARHNKPVGSYENAGQACKGLKGQAKRDCRNKWKCDHLGDRPGRRVGQHRKCATPTPAVAPAG